jgi:exosortase
LPYVIYYSITAPMQSFAARCAAWGLRAVGVQALAQGNIMHLPQGSMGVAEACSGIRSLYAFLALGALVAYFTAIPIWGRFLIFFLTIPLAVIGNAFRVWGSGLGVWLIGPSFAQGAPHELFGVFVFVVSFAIFFGLRKTVRILWSHGTSSPSLSSGFPDSTPPSFAPPGASPETSRRSNNSPGS